MHTVRVPDRAKPLLCFVLLLSLYLAFAGLWLPVEGHGRPLDGNGYLLTFELGAFRFARAIWQSSPTSFSFNLSVTGWLPLVLTFGTTVLLLTIVRAPSRWCATACLLNRAARYAAANRDHGAPTTVPPP